MKGREAFSPLTFEERLCTQFEYNLGPGYPRFKFLAEWQEIRKDAMVGSELPACEDLRPRFSDGTGELERQFGGLIGLHNNYRLFPVLTGSVALHRAMVASKRLLCSTGFKAVRVLSTSPCIDVIPAMASELTYLAPKGVSCGVEGAFIASELERVAELIRTTLSQSTEAGAIVVLTSPENPTGRVWLSDSVEFFLSEFSSERIIFIFDHCFLFSGVHEHESVPCVWDAKDSMALGNWISVFDTGKIFDLDGEKLGFLVGGSKSIEAAIQDAISILQYDISERQKYIFGRIFASTQLTDYIDIQSQICRDNLALCRDSLEKIGARVLEPMAGPLALVSLPSHAPIDDYIEKANRNGVGVVSAEHFFWNDVAKPSLIRLALNRDSDYFEESVRRLCSAWAR